jgi:ribonuclease T2
MTSAEARPVAQSSVRQMLPIMPDRGLIHHEWATHGSCSRLAPQDYFNSVEKAFGELQIPPAYRAPTQAIAASPTEIEQKFAQANHAPASAFRVTCSGGELVGIEVCLTRNLEYRACGVSLRDCRAPQLSIQSTP